MGTLVCTIELNKQGGVSVVIDNADGKIKQSLVFDGTSVTLTVKGEQETSTVVQKADSIHITCKDFKVEAETITCSSKKASVYQSQDTLDMKSTKDMKLTSQAKLGAEATQDLSAKGLKVALQAQTALEAKAMNVAVKADAEAKVEATMLKLAGTGQAELSGAMIKISATGMLNAEATGVATLKGSITNVQGTLVKLG